MESISVIVPSRGRPGNVQRLVTAFQETCRDSTVLHIVVDADDPSHADYQRVYTAAKRSFVALWTISPAPEGKKGIVWPLNHVANTTFTSKHGFYPTILGFMGDDHIPRTIGWDVQIQLEASRMKTGVIYGNDLLQGANLPTQVFLTANIVQALGFMAPPVLNHLYVDNFWKDLGQDLGILKYLPETVIEHLHPLNGKATWDETYEDCNNPNAIRDKQAYFVYRHGAYREDMGKVKSLIPGA